MKSKYIVFVGMGFELIGIIGVGLYLGKAIDDKFQLKGVGLVALLILGLVGWLVHIIALAKRMDGQEEGE
jgi:F0F1-type ATP synthase assembly protein I